MKAHRSLAFALFCLTSTALIAGESRVWTNDQGRQILAVLVRVEGANVVLKLANGQTANVPLASLSPDDQKWVSERPANAAADPARTPWDQRRMPGTVSERQIDMQVRIIKESPGRYIYRSGNFEFETTAKLGLLVMNDVCRAFESTHELVARLPWGITPKPEDGQPLFKAKLLETRDEYLKSGAPTWSAGFYSRKDKVFRIPFKELGLQSKSNVYSRTGAINNDTITHEITHQIMHEYLPYMPVWLIEGTAEYTAALPYKGGVFNIAAAVPSFKESIKKRTNRLRTAKWLGVPEIWKYTHSITAAGVPKPQKPEPVANSGEKEKTIFVNPNGPPLNVDIVDPAALADRYYSSFVLAFYFIHLDGDGQGSRLKQFFDAIQEEKKKWPGFWKQVEEYNKKIDELKPAYDAYRTAMADFMKQSGVKDLGGGRFSYPRTLTPPATPPTPPAMPTPPDNTSPENVVTKHLGALLGDRTVEQLDADVRAAFAKLGITL